MLKPGPTETGQSIRVIVDAIASGERSLAIFRHNDDLSYIRHEFYAPGEISMEELDRRLDSLRDLFGTQVERIDITSEAALTVGEKIFLDPASL